MGTITAAAIINRVAVQLNDRDNLHWPRTELLAWVNEAQRQIVLAQPQSNSVTAPLALVAGAKQSLPAGAWVLLDVYCNLGADGLTFGRAVRGISRTLMDAHDPTWRAARRTKVIQNFMVDAQSPTTFWVYPPADGTTQVEINYATPPTALTVEATAISVNDLYEPAIIEYILYRAHAKKVEYAKGDQISQAHFSAFAGMLGIKQTSEAANSATQAVGTRGGDAPGANS